jgi:hypothetical protein
MANDPFVRFLKAAPLDNEPLSAEGQAAVAEVEADRAAGVTTVSFEQIKRRFAVAPSVLRAAQRA